MATGRGPAGRIRLAGVTSLTLAVALTSCRSSDPARPEAAASPVVAESLVSASPPLLAVPAERETPSVELTIAVLAEEDRMPIPEVDVSLEPGGEGDRRSEVTGVDGTVRFKGVRPDEDSLEVRVRGRRSTRIRPPLVPKGQEVAGGLRREILLSRFQSVRGTVVGLPDRKPLAGATIGVFLTKRGFDSAICSTSPDVTVHTDPEGRFQVEGLPPEDGIAVLATAEGWTKAKVWVAGPFEEPTSPYAGMRLPLSLELQPAGVLRGKVTGPDGKPVSGATVWVLEDRGRSGPGGSNARSEEDSYRREALEANAGWTADDCDDTPTGDSDEEGNFEVHGVSSEGTLCVLATSPRHSPAATVSGVRVPPGTVGTRVNLVLAPPTSLRVRVLRPDGTPDHRSRVELCSGLGSRRVEGRDGRFDFGRVHWETYTLVVNSEEFADEVEHVSILRGQAVERVIRLGPAVPLSGRVVNATGAGVEGVTIHAWARASDSAGASIGGETESRQDGHFEIPGLRPGTYTISLDEGFRSMREVGRFAAPGSDLLLPVSGEVHLSLVPPVGTTLPATSKGVRVFARAAGIQKGIEFETPFPLTRKSMQRYDAADGSVLLRNVPPGATEIVIFVTGFAPLRKQLDVRPGEVLDLGNVTLSVGCILRGRVLDEKGSPQPGTRVWVASGNSAITAADGTFAIPGLVPGTTGLQARSRVRGEDRFALTAIPVEVGSEMTPIDVVRSPGIALEGVVLPSARRSSGWLWVVAKRKDAAEELAVRVGQTDAEGRFRARLLPGSWEIRILDGGFQEVLVNAELQLDSAREPSVVLQLRD